MNHQAVILDFKRKSVKYVRLDTAVKAVEKAGSGKVTAGPSTPPRPARRRKR